jgi:hypothetical protein
MTAPRRSVILFRSVSAALAAEKVLKETDIAFKLIPVPKHISSDCGVCIRIETSDAERARAAVDGKVNFLGVHDLIKNR